MQTGLALTPFAFAETRFSVDWAIAWALLESTTKSATLHDRHALMSDKLSIGNKNHGNCVNNDTGTLSSRRPSAWDIWDKVFFERKRM